MDEELRQRFIKTCKTLLSLKGDDFICDGIKCADCPASAEYNNRGCSATKDGDFSRPADHPAIRRYFENKLKELEGGSMTIQEQIDKIAADAKAKIDELVKLQKAEEWKPVKGEWCIFWDYDWDRRVVRMFDKMENNKYVEITGLDWGNCRKLKPEDVGFHNGKPSWDDAPEWANYMAQCSNGSWWFFETCQKILDGENYWRVLDTGRQEKYVNADNWENTLEEMPKQ